VQQTPQEPTVQQPPQQPPQQPAVKQPPQQPRKQPPGRPRKQRDEEEEEEDIELSDFELTDGEEEDMFVEKEKDVLCEPKDDINTWFQIGTEIPKRALESMQQMTQTRIHMIVSTSTVLDSGKEDNEGSIVKRKKRYFGAIRCSLRSIVPMRLGGRWILNEERVTVGGGNLMIFLVHRQYTSIKENPRLMSAIGT
jgi:hypothetical protein